MSNVKKTLIDNDKTHGDYMTQCELTCNLKAVMYGSVNWTNLTPYQQESLEMIQLKISRILTGNWKHADSWHDIAGYAMLVEDILLDS